MRRSSFDLRLARTAAVADAAALAFEVAPPPHESGGQVLQLREFDLQLAFVALRARREDLEDQHRAVGDRDAQVALEVALLRRRKCLVEQHRLGLVAEHQRLDLVGLARADEQGGVGCLAARDDARDRHVAGRLREQREFVQRRVERRLAAEVDADEDRPGRLEPRARPGGLR